eukprot:356240-Chlamydomonas_euryale.AAC.1
MVSLVTGVGLPSRGAGIVEELGGGGWFEAVWRLGERRCGWVCPRHCLVVARRAANGARPSVPHIPYRPHPPWAAAHTHRCLGVSSGAHSWSQPEAAASRPLPVTASSPFRKSLQVQTGGKDPQGTCHGQHSHAGMEAAGNIPWAA